VKQRKKGIGVSIHLKGYNQSVFAVSYALRSPIASHDRKPQSAIIHEFDRESSTDPAGQGGDLAGADKRGHGSPTLFHKRLDKPGI